MQRISPLKAGLEAFNKFRATKTQKTNNIQNSNSTNPFGISFKGKVMQSDVFEMQTQKSSGATNPILTGFNKMNKFCADVQSKATDKFNLIKNNAISFGSKMKNNIVSAYNKLASTEVSFDFMNNSPQKLQKLPVAKLEEMLRNEVSGIGA